LATAKSQFAFSKAAGMEFFSLEVFYLNAFYEVLCWKLKRAPPFLLILCGTGFVVPDDAVLSPLADVSANYS
jgi:hypothetical protein